MRDKQKLMDDTFLKFINNTGVLAKEIVANLPASEQLSLLLPYLSKGELCELKGIIVNLEEQLGSTPIFLDGLKLQLSNVEKKLIVA